MGLRFLRILGVALGWLALAAGAHAATYCVGTSGCDSAHTKATIAAALAAASADGQNDTVNLGSGTFEAHQVFYTGSHTLAIHGQGRTSTTIQDNTASTTALLCVGAHTALLSVDSLTVQIAAGGQGGLAGPDCPLHVNDVLVNAEFAPYAEALYAGFGTSVVTHSDLEASETASTGTPSTAARADDHGQLQISDSTLIGQIGLWASASSEASPSVQAHRLDITSSGPLGNGILAEGGSVSLDDSLLHLTGGTTGIQTYQSYGHSAGLTGRQLTLIGDGSGTGAHVSSFSGGGSSTITLRDSILSSADGTGPGFAYVLGCDSGAGASGPATLHLAYDDLTLPASDPCVGPGPTSYDAPGNNLNGVNPHFVGAGNFQLSATSPVRQIDAVGLFPGESATDLLGQPRIRGQRRDLGAYEYQPLAPSVLTGGATAVTFTRAVLHGSVSTQNLITTYHFLYGTSTHYGHTTATLTTTFGQATALPSMPIGPLLPGHTYHYRLVAENGLPNQGVDRTFRTPQACVVPRLAGKTLHQARRALARAHCRLGRVRHRHILHGRTGRVIAQSPRHRPRHLYPAGKRVAVTLGRR